MQSTETTPALSPAAAWSWKKSQLHTSKGDKVTNQSRRWKEGWRHATFDGRKTLTETIEADDIIITRLHTRPSILIEGPMYKQPTSLQTSVSTWI